MAKKSEREGLRVKMVIYSDTDEAIVHSDEPLYNDDEEITHQAWRLLERLEDKQYDDEPTQEHERKDGSGVDELDQ